MHGLAGAIVKHIEAKTLVDAMAQAEWSSRPGSAFDRPREAAPWPASLLSHAALRNPYSISMSQRSSCATAAPPHAGV